MRKEEESLELKPLYEIYENLKEDVATRTIEPKYRTGLTELDDLIWGLHKREVMTVGARTSQGKSAFVTHLLRHLGDTGLKVIDFTNEMTEEQMCERLVTNICRINNVELRQGAAKKEFEESTEIFSNWAKSSKILLTNKYGRRFPQALEVCEMIKPDFIFIDYIQMVTGEGDKRQAIEDFLIRIGELAKDMNFGVINVSQINRDGSNGRPSIHQLKWSGVLEEFSDTVLLLHYEWEKSKYTIYVAKQRHGMTGEIKVKFLPEFNTFEDYTYVPSSIPFTHVEATSEKED